MCGQVHHGLVSPIIASWANSCSWSQELLSLARTLWVNWLSQCISHQANHNELRQVSQTCVLSLAAAEGWHFWPRTTCVRGTQWHLFWKNTFSSRFSNDQIPGKFIQRGAQYLAFLVAMSESTRLTCWTVIFKISLIKNVITKLSKYSNPQCHISYSFSI